VIEIKDTSLQAYNELKRQGKISDRYDFAYKKVLEFYREKGYWPTAKEVDLFVRFEKEHGRAKYSGGNYVKPRITEMVPGREKGPDLLEYEEEREQKYCEKAVRGDVDGIADDEFEEMSEDDVPSANSLKPLEEGEDEGSGGSGTDQEASGEEDGTEDSEASKSGEKSNLEDDVDREEEGEEDSFDSGDVIFGSEDSSGDSTDDQDDTGEDSEDRETMTVEGVEYVKDEDGVWVSQEEGEEDYLFPPSVDEDEYRENKDEENSSEGLNENQGEEDGEKQEKQPSLNEI
jgi:hypothetical protein